MASVLDCIERIPGKLNQLAGSVEMVFESLRWQNRWCLSPAAPPIMLLLLQRAFWKGSADFTQNFITQMYF